MIPVLNLSKPADFDVRMLAEDDVGPFFSSHFAFGVISLIRGPVMLDHREVRPM